MRLVWLVVVVLAGCYAPAIPEGAPCTTSVECPAPLVCTQGECRSSAVPDDGSVRDGPGDGSLDAPGIDGAPACAPLVTGTFTNMARIDELDADGLDGTPWVSNDGLEIFFKSARGNSSASQTDLWTATRPSVASPWGPPSKITVLSTAASEGTPRLSPDRLRMWFSSERTGIGDIYTSVRATTSSPWQPPTPIAELNSPQQEEGLFVLPSQLVAYLHSERDGVDAPKIYRTTRATLDDAWSTPVQVGPTDGNYENPFVTPDECVLYVQVQRASGSTDIEVMTRPTPTGTWGAPVKLGGVNTPGFDGDPFLSADQRTLYYGTGATFTVLEIWQATR